jgi:1,4-alpha-glucan branching enzyme
MTELARRFPQPDALQERMLKQAARELLLAQASDWPFILQTGTSPGYARQRVQDHLLRFTRIYEQLTTAQLDPEWLKEVEWRDNIFPDVDYRYWT